MYDIIMWFVMSDMRGLQMANKLPLLSLWQRNQETMRTGGRRLLSSPFHSHILSDWKDFLQCKTSGANHLHTKVTGGFVSIAAWLISSAWSLNLALAQSSLAHPLFCYYHATKKLTERYCGRKNVTWHWYCTLIGHYQIQVVAQLSDRQSTSPLPRGRAGWRV